MGGEVSVWGGKCRCGGRGGAGDGGEVWWGSRRGGPVGEVRHNVRGQGPKSRAKGRAKGHAKGCAKGRA